MDLNTIRKMTDQERTAELARAIQSEIPTRYRTARQPCEDERNQKRYCQS